MMIRVYRGLDWPSSTVVPNLFWCIAPFAHFGTFHSTLM